MYLFLFFSTFRTQPNTSWRSSDPDTIEMEPFERTIVVVTADHVSVRHRPADTIQRLVGVDGHVDVCGVSRSAPRRAGELLVGLHSRGGGCRGVGLHQAAPLLVGAGAGAGACGADDLCDLGGGCGGAALRGLRGHLCLELLEVGVQLLNGAVDDAVGAGGVLQFGVGQLEGLVVLVADGWQLLGRPRPRSGVLGSHFSQRSKVCSRLDFNLGDQVPRLLIRLSNLPKIFPNYRWHIRNG